MSIQAIQEILERLPHRYPFLLIDRVIDFKKGKALTAIKNVTINEPFFTGHFPNEPVMPGVLILEALAQASGVLVLRSEESVSKHTHIFLFAGIDNARFKRLVTPGDQLLLHVKQVREKRGVYKMEASATVENELACSAELMIIRSERE